MQNIITDIAISNKIISDKIGDDNNNPLDSVPAYQNILRI